MRSFEGVVPVRRDHASALPFEFSMSTLIGFSNSITEIGSSPHGWATQRQLLFDASILTFAAGLDTPLLDIADADSHCRPLRRRIRDQGASAREIYEAATVIAFIPLRMPTGEAP
jgi:hypothetical protein